MSSEYIGFSSESSRAVVDGEVVFGEDLQPSSLVATELLRGSEVLEVVVIRIDLNAMWSPFKIGLPVRGLPFLAIPDISGTLRTSFSAIPEISGTVVGLPRDVVQSFSRPRPRTDAPRRGRGILRLVLFGFPSAR